MAKLKNIVQQLSAKDYSRIYQSLIENGAEKSAFLLQTLREKNLSDRAIMSEIDVNHNAYYTLRSRLNQKIEEYLLQQMESPRADLLKKVANINEILFTKKPAIAITTLKKLEKELLDYDLSNELISVYRALKKLYAHSSKSFHYSQLYNRRVAYSLAVDKAEELLMKYFISFAEYSLSGDTTQQTALGMMSNEMDNTCNMYTSHRLFIYQNCLSVMHRLWVEDPKAINHQKPPIEDVLNQAASIFNNYASDATYFHLQKVYSFLRFQYYTRYQLYQKAEDYFEELDENITSLLTNYHYYTFPAFFLYLKLERSLRQGNIDELYDSQDIALLDDDFLKQDTPQFIYCVVYKTIVSYYAGHFEEAARELNSLLNQVSLKKYPIAGLEIKSLLALQYCFMGDQGLFKQISNSIQRQIRMSGKEQCADIVLFNKILKVAMSEAKRDKITKIKELSVQLSATDSSRIFNPIRLIQINNQFLSKLLENVAS